jgi:hypothetical protein
VSVHQIGIVDFHDYYKYYPGRYVGTQVKHARCNPKIGNQAKPYGADMIYNSCVGMKEPEWIFSTLTDRDVDIDPSAFKERECYA